MTALGVLGACALLSGWILIALVLWPEAQERRKKP